MVRETHPETRIKILDHLATVKTESFPPPKRRNRSTRKAQSTNTKKLDSEIHYSSNASSFPPNDNFLSSQARDEETELEASNDEFELSSTTTTSTTILVDPGRSSIKNRVLRSSSSHAHIDMPAPRISSDLSIRQAKRASGEHLWKHRCFWDEEETEYLKAGVQKYGKGKWKAILSDPAFRFKDRSSVDLKDKWRNLETFIPWSDHEIRRYILLDEGHVPIRNAQSNYHIFQNRWPRDAALKVASRDEFYPNGTDDCTPFLIYLREIRSIDPDTNPEEQYLSEEEQVVHVYEGTRERKVAADIEKFHNKRFMWVASVVKLRTEKLSFGRKNSAVSISNHDSISAPAGVIGLIIP